MIPGIIQKGLKSFGYASNGKHSIVSNHSYD